VSNPPDPRFPNLRADVVAGYLDAPETMVAEVIDGELSLMPRPNPRHSRAAGEVHGELRGPFRRGRGGPGGGCNPFPVTRCGDPPRRPALIRHHGR